MTEASTKLDKTRVYSYVYSFIDLVHCLLKIITLITTMRLFTQLSSLVFLFLSFSIQAQDSYSLIIESNESTVTTGTTYRFYVEMIHPTDKFSAVFGHNDLPLTISASSSFISAEASDELQVSPKSFKISVRISDRILERFDLSVSL